MATATFIALDTTTSGAWRGTYGSDGYAFPRLIGMPADSLPGYISGYHVYDGVSGTVDSTYFDWWSSSTTNASPSTDTRGVQDPSTVDHWAVTWYDSTMLRIFFDAGVGGTRLALYCLDYEGSGRSQTLSVMDGVILLDIQSVSEGNGKWLVWDITGSVHIDLRNTGGPNAVTTMLAFGPYGGSPPPPPAENLGWMPRTIYEEVEVDEFGNAF